jgi:hypothetical protein
MDQGTQTQPQPMGYPPCFTLLSIRSIWDESPIKRPVRPMQGGPVVGKTNPISSLNDAFSDGVTYQLGARMHIQLAHDILTVPGYCLGADNQRLGNFVITGPLC